VAAVLRGGREGESTGEEGGGQYEEFFHRSFFYLVCGAAGVTVNLPKEFEEIFQSRCSKQSPIL